MELSRDDVMTELARLYYATGANGFFETPTMKVAAASDPWFQRLKHIIGEFHWTPEEALRMSFPEAHAKSVIVWSLPLDGKSRDGNRHENAKPCLDWARARSFGELANENIRKCLCKYLEAHGYASVAPHLQIDVGEAMKRLAANWSERHVAFVAGMGTFGLSAGLITEHGIAHRLGSVVTELELPPDARPYGNDPFAWCTKCGACARRCPAHAIGPDFKDRDKQRCLEYAVKVIGKERLNYYGWTEFSLGCGLCQTGVPCEYSRPQQPTQLNGEL